MQNAALLEGGPGPRGEAAEMDGDKGSARRAGDEESQGEAESQNQAKVGWACPHDGSRLVPLADTPNWFRCGGERWKHYFYRRLGREGGGWIDVDTNEPVRMEPHRRYVLRPRQKGKEPAPTRGGS